MKNSTLLIISALSLPCLSACTPTYQPQNLAKTVRINLTELDNPQICLSTRWYSLAKDANGYTNIPYGNRINLRNLHTVSSTTGYLMETDSCKPGFSFIPQKNQNYYVSFSTGQSVCTITILRGASNSRVGYKVDSTARPASGNCAENTWG